jgi:hypothetical protein
MTEAKKRIIRASDPAHVSFLKEHWDELEEGISRPDLYGMYKDYCKENSRGIPLGKPKFEVYIEEYTGAPSRKRLKRYGTKRPEIYVMKPEWTERFKKENPITYDTGGESDKEEKKEVENDSWIVVEGEEKEVVKEIPQFAPLKSWSKIQDEDDDVFLEKE